MLIEYTGDHRLYPRWLLQQLPTYSMQRNDLMQRLNCSTTWIDEIQRHVDFIKILRPSLSRAFLKQIAVSQTELDTIRQVLSYRSSVYLNAQQVITWLTNNGTYTQQTRMVSINAAFHGDEGLAERYWLLQTLAQAPDATMGAKRARTEFLRQHCPDALITPYQRNETPALPVEPFDWFSGNFVAGNSKEYPNRESLNRSMYKRGAIRITFGKNKTFFAVPPAPDERCICIRANSNIR